MHLYEHGTPEYSDTTTLNNAMMERRPTAVARCASPADVAAAIAHARRERLPLAVGQLVLSLSSAPGVDGIRLVTSGEAVDVPLPDGALADRPVTADDYVELLPPDLVAGTGPARTLSRDVGCPA